MKPTKMGPMGRKGKTETKTRIVLGPHRLLEYPWALLQPQA